MASGSFDGEKWVWEKVNWKKFGSIWNSNRHIPKEFWKQFENVDLSEEIKSRAGVVMVRMKKEPEFFMVCSYWNHFGFPKGTPDEGENPKKAAEREFYEETGTKIDLSNNPLELIVCEADRIFNFYLVKVPEDFEIETKPISDHEITAFGWIPISRISSYKLSSLTCKIFDCYKRSPFTPK
jgi:8-oxo-dGTP pyrophosphatase MutT (NUDIX family)